MHVFRHKGLKGLYGGLTCSSRLAPGLASSCPAGLPGRVGFLTPSCPRLASRHAARRGVTYHHAYALDAASRLVRPRGGWAPTPQGARDGHAIHAAMQ